MPPEANKPAEIPVKAPENVKEFIEQGWRLHVQKDYTRSEADFRKALSLDNSSIEAYYGLGLSLKMQGQNADALEALQTVIKLVESKSIHEDPNRITMLRRLTEAHINILKGNTL